MTQQNKQSAIYDNWRMLSPAGVLLARTSQKRAQWYLKKGIAELEAEKTIRLNFEPEGNVNPNVPFLLEEKQNQCVVCGTTQDLNRHHVVPYQYRKWLPDVEKGYSSYDVLPICITHHERYEKVAQVFSRELVAKYDAPFSIGKLDVVATKTKKMFGLLKVIASGRPVPQERYVAIKLQVEEFFSQPIDQTVARQLIKATPQYTCISTNKPHGSVVIEKVLMVNGLQEFTQSWRAHFIKVMNPKFLSKNWDIYHVHNK